MMFLNDLTAFSFNPGVQHFCYVKLRFEILWISILYNSHMNEIINLLSIYFELAI